MGANSMIFTVGLGKSLSIISLIAANQYLSIATYFDPSVTTVKTTLLVVPLPPIEL
jgi:SNF2 family DNA or RNA helicase